jgi:hypothetical protein
MSFCLYWHMSNYINLTINIYVIPCVMRGGLKSSNAIFLVTSLMRYIYNNIGLLHEYWWILSRAVYYCVSVRVQYDILRGIIFTNIHAIILLLYSNKYFFFRSVINTVKIWFFHISLLYCTKCFRKNILIFALVQYEWHSERTGIFSGSYKAVRDQQ